MDQKDGWHLWCTLRIVGLRKRTQLTRRLLGMDVKVCGSWKGSRFAWRHLWRVLIGELNGLYEGLHLSWICRGAALADNPVEANSKIMHKPGWLVGLLSWHGDLGWWCNVRLWRDWSDFLLARLNGTIFRKLQWSVIGVEDVTIAWNRHGAVLVDL